MTAPRAGMAYRLVADPGPGVVSRPGAAISCLNSPGFRRLARKRDMT